jgi:serine/threonine-protein kinase
VAVAYQHVSETPTPPTEVNEQVPRALDAIVLRAMAKDPYQRFPDAASFRVALKSVTEGAAPSKKDIGALTSELYGPNPRHAQETARSLRQLSADTTMTRTQSGPPVAWIWAGVALLAVLLISVLIWVITLTMRPNEVPTTSVTVPNLVNLTSDDAQKVLEDKGLVPDMRQEASVDFEEDHVIRSSPTTGAKLTKGTSVIVYVSTGADTVEMPVVEGLPEDTAKQILADAKLTLGTVRPQNDKDAKAGTVLSASEAAGSEVAIGTTVDLVVASGMVTLENMTGFSMEAATGQLEKLGLEAVPVELGPCTEGQIPDVVASMSLSPGEVPIHSSVELRYCVAAAE